MAGRPATTTTTDSDEDRMAEDVRLDRIEQKLDRLSDAVVSLARMEERMITLFRRTDGIDTDVKDAVRRLADLERVSYGRGFFFRAVDRVSWLAIGGAIGLLFTLFRGDAP